MQTSFNALFIIISTTFTSGLLAVVVYFARKILLHTAHSKDNKVCNDNIIANNIQTIQPLAEILVQEDEENISLLDKQCK